MFNIGAPELLVIAAFALIILGPEKFPTQAKVFLRMFREFREHWDDAKRDIMSEINPVKKEFRELRKFKPEELLDRLTGEDQDTAEEPAKVVEAPPADTTVEPSTTGANEAPVEFESATSATPEGRSEESQWDRKDTEEAAPAAALTEEDEYRSAEAAYDIRPKDGTD